VCVCVNIPPLSGIPKQPAVKEPRLGLVKAS
jgi:hypothetical protein